MNERAPLVLGALLGALLAARGVLSRPSPALPPGAVAAVDGRPILRADYERALAAVAADRREGSVPTELRAQVLDRLVDEELLLSRGVALGLPSRDARVRTELVSAMLEIVARTEDEAPPGDAELRAFHARERLRFARPSWIHVEAAYFGGEPEGAGRRARAARMEPTFEQAIARADRPPLPLPDGPVPPRKLVDYLGPEAVEAALALPVGATSGPIAARSGVYLLRVVGRGGGAELPFDEVRDEVLAAFRRDGDERRLRRWLADQRASARVVLAPL